MHRGFYGVVLAAVVLAGCSTVPVPEGAAKAVSAERVYKPEYLTASVGHSAQIYLTRDKGLGGSACSHDISLNNEKILSIRQAEAATLYVAPGSYFLKLETGGGLCPNISTSQNLTVAAGERQVYRILLPSDGNLRLTREK
ncbi:hypothetical protein [uncultured Stenotrophomonas sp.]|uniref:hypothetical protein n=1 Tax=uncultured Stenotrophomonas sp. TaxID=165438 RepID=UPI00258C370A|nr:hypothetical protein [uncultured Stenotrophomonas sp.]